MNVLCTLKDLLTIPGEANVNEISGRFSKIANIMFSSLAIKHGCDYYRFSDIEFYFYNKHHKDIITHPRNCDAMKWYVNDFGGIDLTFKSHIKTDKFKNSQKKDIVKPVLYDDSYFGGILIRELVNTNSGEELEGPWACSELFRIHDAIGNLDNYPVLCVYNTGRTTDNPITRLNLRRHDQKVEDKVKYILSTYGNSFTEDSVREMVCNFSSFENKLYRYKSI